MAVSAVRRRSSAIVAPPGDDDDDDERGDDDVIQPEPEVVSCDVTASDGNSNECCSEAAAKAAQCAIHDSRQAISGNSGGTTGSGNGSGLGR